MDRQLARIRSQQAAAVEHKAQQGCFPEEYKREVVEYARRRRATGVTWMSIARSVALSKTTVRRWTKQYFGADASGLLPVVVEPDDERALGCGADTALEPQLIVETPKGLRVSGLNLEHLVSLIERVG